MLSRNLRLASRQLSYSVPKWNLFGGSKTIHPSPGSGNLSAPSGKGESAPDPVDLIKRNDMLAHSQKPRNNIESVRSNGFLFSSNIIVASPSEETGDIIGTLLIDSDIFEVNLSANGFNLVNGFIVEFDEKSVLSVFSKIHPKPEIVVIGLGKQSRVLSESNRKYFSSLGIQIEVSDSNNAAQNFDLLATERPNVVGALMLPPNV
ncbi:putative NADH dehydrogenase [ubiquinone] 1 alpha subcomplex assembly factor 3 [[Candida] railenensis]|uniref:NADH dehydrogenase [ubiquinone] 1 alpha subcomplex assembly factor 3 n=1 Tax=[Candida] railenensis TaxID=45579 RepID=A0A9P0QU05_9ASCO|nr:putative NADH dehydrogenase [ubiquinone] 1 alpha subcomplex assembly factor 3 [[Candida] railenensis]